MSIGNIELKIKTQLLTTISIERSLIIHDEIVYNSMAREFTKIHKAVFKLQCRFVYSSIDVEISTSCRTPATSPQLKPYPDLEDLIEI